MPYGKATGVRPVRRFLKLLGGGLTAATLLSVPAFALSALAPWGGAAAPAEGRPAIAAADDAVADGFRIVEAPVVAAAAQAAATGEAPAETVLRDWQFTGRPVPSPGK
jgi:hypothetical protein